MYHSLFTHLPIEGYHSCFQIFAVMNKASLVAQRVKNLPAVQETRV